MGTWGVDYSLILKWILKCRSESLGWINVAHDMDLWLNLVDTVTNFMFLWPYIMNWLYINYQLDALIII